MTHEEIVGIMIKAAKTDRLLPDTASPKRLKAIDYGYISEPNGEETRNRVNSTRNDVGLWEAAMELIVLEPRIKHRRALWAWSKSKAGGQRFKAWCKAEGIHAETGRRRAKAAIESIASAFRRKPFEKNEIVVPGLLPEGNKIEYKKDRLAVWRDDEAEKASVGALADFRGWREARNAERRARYAR